ncbi:MAG: chemotaxis protein CheA [Pseudomonadota bacterium]|nr:chemotaxis protein CheA [Pseudomonadota bacterium]
MSSPFGAMTDLLGDFLTEAGELLSDLDNKLVELEKNPNDRGLLNDIFRSFHTIKGGAGFLNVTPLVSLCHRTENLFDKLRTETLVLSPELMDHIMDATAAVRHMFGFLTQNQMPPAADEAVLLALDAALSNQPALPTVPSTHQPSHQQKPQPDWDSLYNALTDQHGPVRKPPEITDTIQTLIQPLNEVSNTSPPPAKPAPASRPSTIQPAASNSGIREASIRVDINRLDMVLNLAGEIGLTKNRLTCLRTGILNGTNDGDTLHALDEAVSQLDLLVGNLQNAVMKTRMQPIGRLFQKFPRMVRDLSRQLGKEVELVIEGEDTEIDKTMIEDLNDPLVHLIRNALDHGVDSPDERLAQGKPACGIIRLSAMQSGDHILIEINDDGRGINPETIRNVAVQKGLIDIVSAKSLDDKQACNLIFMPGFSTKQEISDISGRGVGMDVVKTNIQKLNGRIDVRSTINQGTNFLISLPLTLAILPVLIVEVSGQPFAVPLSMVREILPIDPSQIQEVSGRATMVLRNEVLPVRSLASFIHWPDSDNPAFGVLMHSAETSFILTIDRFIGQDDVVIKPLLDIKPEGVAGATLSGDGGIVLVLDMETLVNKAA